VRAEQLTDPVAYHGEGPVWSSRWGGLRWVDMLAGDVLSLRPDGSVDRRHVGAIAAALRPRRDGGAVIGVEHGFALEAPDGTLTTLGELWRADAGLRMNDGGCDPDGRFYCGSMAYDRTAGAAALFRLDPDGSTHVVLDGVTISNGLEWSPDGSRAYYNDTETYRVDVFDYDRDAGLVNRRPFAQVATDDGRPDGLTVDAEGGVWVALNHSGTVRRLGASGEVDAVVEVPPRQVTACTFGGDGLETLFITTSRENLPPGADPLAGALFRADVGVRGIPAREFAG
jgi:sugar lactone lactonase YvrE